MPEFLGGDTRVAIGKQQTDLVIRLRAAREAQTTTSAPIPSHVCPFDVRKAVHFAIHDLVALLCQKKACGNVEAPRNVADRGKRGVCRSVLDTAQHISGNMRSRQLCLRHQLCDAKLPNLFTDIHERTVTFSRI